MFRELVCKECELQVLLYTFTVIVNPDWTEIALESVAVVSITIKMTATLPSL